MSRRVRELDEHLVDRPSPRAGDGRAGRDSKRGGTRPAASDGHVQRARVFDAPSRCRRSRRTRRSICRAWPGRATWRSPASPAAIASRHSCRAAASRAVRGKEPIVTGMGGEAGVVLRVGVGVLAAPQVEVAVAEPEPADLLARQLWRRQRCPERRAHAASAPRWCGLRISAQRARRGAIGQVMTRSRRGCRRSRGRVVLRRAPSGSRRRQREATERRDCGRGAACATPGPRRIGAARGGSAESTWAAASLREPRLRRERRAAGLGTERVARVAGLARPLKVETGQARQVASRRWDHGRRALL